MRGVGIGYDCALSKDDAPVAKLKTRPVINWGVTEPGRFARLFSAFSRCLRLDGLRLLRRAHSAGEPAKWDSQAASNGRATANPVSDPLLEIHDGPFYELDQRHCRCIDQITEARGGSSRSRDRLAFRFEHFRKAA